VAAERGDLRLLVVPDCFSGMPGYKDVFPPALAPMILWKMCDGLLGTEFESQLHALRQWAEEYNSYIQNRQRMSPGHIS